MIHTRGLVSLIEICSPGFEPGAPRVHTQHHIHIPIEKKEFSPEKRSILKKELKSNKKELKSNIQLEHGIWKKELFS